MKTFSKLFKGFIVVLAFIGVMSAGYFYGKSRFTFEVRKNIPDVEIVNKKPDATALAGKYDFSLYWSVWDKVSTMYLERPVNAQRMMDGSIKALDDYNAPKETESTASTGGN